MRNYPILLYKGKANLFLQIFQPETCNCHISYFFIKMIKLITSFMITGEADYEKCSFSIPPISSILHVPVRLIVEL